MQTANDAKIASDSSLSIDIGDLILDATSKGMMSITVDSNGMTQEILDDLISKGYEVTTHYMDGNSSFPSYTINWGNIIIYGGSILFNGTSSALTISGSTDWAMGTGDFTAEWFQYQTSMGFFPRIFSVGTYAFNSISFAVTNESDMLYVWLGGGWRLYAPISDYLNKWTHFAVTRHGTDLKIFQNGIEIASTTDSTDITDSTTPMSIGYEIGPDIGVTYFQGLITNLHIVKGTSLYNSNFDVPTVPIVKNSNSKLLLKAITEGGLIDDSSGTNKIVENVDSTWSVENPFDPTANEFLLTFDDIANASLMIGGDSSNIDDWNSFFNILTGTSFTSVAVNGNTVNLKGGANIHLNDSLFDNPYGYSLISVIDTLGCVVSAGEDVFGDDYHGGCFYITTISFPALETAGYYCFGDLISLTSINLPSLTSAGYLCFSSCESLENLSLPSLIFADEGCFGYCLSLTGISLPSLITGGTSMFNNSISLSTIYMPSCVALGSTVNDDGVFANILNKSISLTVPTELLTCNDGQPDGDIIYLTLRNSVTINNDPYIPFSGYTGNLSITFDDINNASLMIGGDASNIEDWNSFFSIKSWSVPFSSLNITGNTVDLIGGENIAIDDLLFQYNPYIIDIVDMGCIAYVGMYSFEGCVKLTGVSFANVTKIDDGSFGYNAILTNAIFPKLLSAGISAFASCVLLVNLDFSNLVTAGELAFAGCESLNANFPNLINAGRFCFYQCTALVSPNFSNLQIIGGYCFGSCVLLFEPDFSKLITAGEYSFLDCASLDNPSIPLLTTAGEGCFNGCSSLTTLSLPSLITAGVACLSGCASLTTLSLPSLITAGDACFNNCILLTSISIPLCAALGSTVGDNSVFGGITGNTITLTVPSALMTCNIGNPDGDIEYLNSNNTLTVIQV